MHARGTCSMRPADCMCERRCQPADALVMRSMSFDSRLRRRRGASRIEARSE
jgi:hypothetical protein